MAFKFKCMVKKFKNSCLCLSITFYLKIFRYRVLESLLQFQLGIDVPALYFLDTTKNRIIMERIGGELTVRDYIERVRVQQPDSFLDVLRPLANDIGEMLANLHKANMVHGDLTTSNLLLRNADANKLVVIDFGLSYGQVSYVLNANFTMIYFTFKQFWVNIVKS